MIQVWHKNPLERGNFMVNMEGILKQEDYRHVADIDTDDLEEAFKLSNHIDTAWYYNPGVVMHHWDRVRSSSVGDIFIRNGELHEIASFDFYRSVWASGG